MLRFIVHLHSGNKANFLRLQSIKHTFCSVNFTCFYTIYSSIQRHVSMPMVFRHILIVNCAARISAIKLERERIFVQIPFKSAIILENIISFPWQ